MLAAHEVDHLAHGDRVGQCDHDDLRADEVDPFEVALVLGQALDDRNAAPRPRRSRQMRGSDSITRNGKPRRSSAAPTNRPTRP
jgi:hypothetical protein